VSEKVLKGEAFTDLQECLKSQGNPDRQTWDFEDTAAQGYALDRLGAMEKSMKKPSGNRRAWGSSKISVSRFKQGTRRPIR
jgi:hypothetical protein